jgi:hypothetical protein
MAVSETFVHIPWWTYLNCALVVAFTVGVVWFVRRYLPRFVAAIRHEWDKAGPPPAQPPQ